MRITQTSAKDIVKELDNYEKQINKKFLGKKNSNDYFVFLKREFQLLTLEQTKPNNYRLAKKDQTTNNPLVLNKDASNLLTYYLIEISNSTSLYGYTKVYELAYDLFNELFVDF